MSDMNFGFSTTSAVRNTRRPLAPWGIYKVKFTGAEIAVFKGSKDPSVEYKVLRFNFENEDGYYSESLFFPKEGDDIDREYENNGGTMKFPSNFKVTMSTVKQTLQVLSPKGWEAVQKASAKFKSFDDVANAAIKVLDKVKGTETEIKLVGKVSKGKVVAKIPTIIRYNKEGELYVSDNYIGTKLYFTDYEEGERTKYLNAKPTTPSPKTETPAPTTEASTDNELDALLGAL
mgnify:CR=1 FL=1